VRKHLQNLRANVDGVVSLKHQQAKKHKKKQLKINPIALYFIIKFWQTSFLFF